MYPMNFQPYNSPYGQYMQQSLVRVNGIEGAKAYQMGANSVVALFDSNEDLMFVKSTDGAGFPMIRTFKFEEVTGQEKQIEQNDFVSRKEMEEYGKQLIQQFKAERQNGANNANGKQH